MKIAFIADSEQELDVFPDLIEALHEEVKDLESKEFFVPTILDIPAKCLEAEGFDLIFAMHLYEEEEGSEKDFRIKLVLEKIIDFELSHKARVLKAIEPSGLEDALTEDDFETVKQAFVEKWKAIILGVLFDQEVFRPKASEESEDSEEDFSGEDEREF